jgi:hypothetical protein
MHMLHNLGSYKTPTQGSLHPWTHDFEEQAQAFSVAFRSRSKQLAEYTENKASVKAFRRVLMV